MLSRITAFTTLLLACSASAADMPRDAAIAMKVTLDGDAATVTVAFNYTGKAGDPPTFHGVRMFSYELSTDKGPTRVGWEGKDSRQTVVMGGKRYMYYPALTDRAENGTLSVAKVDGGKLRLTGVYHHYNTLFVIDETVKPGDLILLEAKCPPVGNHCFFLEGKICYGGSTAWQAVPGACGRVRT